MRSSVHTRIRFIFSLACVFFATTGCGGSSTDSTGAGGSGGAADPGGIAQTWSGTWLSHSGVGGAEVFDLTLSAGTVSGSVSFTGSPCFQSGDLQGWSSGDTLSGMITAGGIEVSFSGVIDGDQLSGTYATIAAGACTGDTGTFSATR